MDVSSLAKGYYIIQLKTNSVNFSGKIMIAH
ncbi:MAG: T9SS type A sorting domain-containing protein [Tannerella sp.]|nr:T9SS type A sorting domain-containing protein [Tannerella sp.]